MRHTACYMVLLAALLVACSEDRTDSGKAVVPGSEGTVTFAARDGFDTRTALDGTRVVWERGDGVGIFCPQIAEAANYRATIADTDDGQSSATLTTGLRYASGEHTFYAYYPHTEQSGVDASTTTVTGLLASEQDGDTGKNGFMWATTTATPGADPITLQFRHPFTYLDIQLRSSGEFLGAAVRSISIRAAEGKTLAGSFTADLTSGKVTFTDPVAEVSTSSPVTALTDAYQETFAVINAEDLTGTDVTVSVTLERDEQLYEFWKSLPGRQFNPQTKTNLKLTIEEMDHDITFADATVESLCVANWDLDGDGKLSTDEAAAVSDLGKVFQRNSKIVSFDELQYFTGLTKIGANAFEYNTKLTSIVLPESIKEIEDYAMRVCPFTEIIIPENVSTIGKNAFASCQKLTSIVIPDNVTSMDTYAFSGCTALKEVTLGCGLTQLTGYQFQGCTSLERITIPENITTIGSNSFDKCSGLTEVILPETLSSIMNAAFQNCSSLEQIIIPANVISIANYAFSGCSKLMDIYCQPTIPPTLGTNVFRNVPGTIHVPSGSIDSYKAATNWSNYEAQIAGYDF